MPSDPSEILNGPSPEPRWTDREIEMMNVVEVFKHKPAIMKKAEDYLTRLKEAVAAEMAGSGKNFPQGTDREKGQVARGENHKGFPFISMDMPQKFSRSEMFTYRTLFWWGHYLGFSFILKGEALPAWENRLMVCKDRPESRDLFLARAPTPWEWDVSYFVPLAGTAEEEIRRIISDTQYIKLCRFYPVSDPAFPRLNWVSTGLETFRDMIRIILG